MDLTNLKYFSAVADTGSFSRAAISLNMAQPSISRAVKLLEEEFGQLLLERNGRGVRLTEAGLTLRSHAQSIFEAAERAKSDMADRLQNPRGKFTVELGFEALVAYATSAMYAPVGTPEAIIKKLTKAIEEASRDEAYIKKLDTLGVAARYMSPSELSKSDAAEYERWGRVVKSANIQP